MTKYKRFITLTPGKFSCWDEILPSGIPAAKSVPEGTGETRRDPQRKRTKLQRARNETLTFGGNETARILNCLRACRPCGSGDRARQGGRGSTLTCTAESEAWTRQRSRFRNI
jgi:hypothetical protein